MNCKSVVSIDDPDQWLDFFHIQERRKISFKIKDCPCWPLWLVTHSKTDQMEVNDDASDNVTDDSDNNDDNDSDNTKGVAHFVSH